MNTNKTVTNLVGGDISPLVHGRIDLPVYQKGAAKLQNFIAMTQGGAKYRCGTKFVRYTRLNKKAILIPFQFSDQQSYLIEATDQRFRFYKDSAVITESPKTITGITNASPGVVTSAAHGFANGDEVYIDSVSGLTQLNGLSFLVAGVTANDFTLTDIFGNAINTTTYGVYTSGGTASRVYEITTPYLEADLEQIQFAQNADTMYIANQNYEPRKLTRKGHANWTLATYTRTTDPFTSTLKSISAVTLANPGVFTSAAHGLSDGVRIFFSGVTGMTQLNGNFYLIKNSATNTFTLTDLNGVDLDTSAFGAFGSGSMNILDKYPRAVTFTDTGRILFGGTRANPETVFGSKAPSTGTTDFDNFTNGTSATDGITFTFAPILGRVDAIQALSNTSKAVVAVTFGTIRRLYGGTEQEAISPTSVTAKAVNAAGGAFTLPVTTGESFYYVQRDRRSLRSLEYDISSDGYTTTDRNLISEHLTVNGIKQIIVQQGQPDIIWAVRYDGWILGLTFKEKEDISGWHRHYVGGKHLNTKGITMTFGKVLWLGNMPRELKYQQLWFVVERRIGGQTVRSVEYMADQPEFPIRDDYYTGNEAVDDAKFKSNLYETQKDSVHLDMAVTYDGGAYGTTANAALTPSAVSGVGITLTATAAVFNSGMVGREIRKQYDINGDGGGRARITSYVSPTQVLADTTVAFDSTAQMAAGTWLMTATTISGLSHLEGETVKIVADGGTVADAVVTAGSITLTSPSTKVHVGYGYRGIVKYLNIDTGGQTGSAQAKSRNMRKLSIRFYNTLGAQIGTNIYHMDREVFRSTADITGRPTPPFSGIKEQSYSDSWEATNKQVLIMQEEPLPCTVLAGDFFAKTVDSGG